MRKLLQVGVDGDSAAHLAAALGPGVFQYRYAEASHAVRALVSWQPDLVMVDLPPTGAVSLCRLLREMCDTPIVVCAMSGREADVVRAFEAGADDYLVMPMRPVEMTARLQAVVRRTSHRQLAGGGDGVLVAGDLEINLDEHRVYRRGVPIVLSPIEFRLLAALVREAGRAVSHSKLLSSGWGPEYVDCRHYLRLYMRYLRAKIEENPQNPQHILNEWGVGYRFEPQPA